MEDLQYPIWNNCRVTLPKGLRELMSDITREVLRAQPTNINHFISDYLSALLLARDSLSIAGQICRDICECSCYPELDEELKVLGLDDEELYTAKSIIEKYLDKGEVKECNLLMELYNKTSMNDEMLRAIQEAVRRAFRRHHSNHSKRYEMPLASDSNEATAAAIRTLGMYKKSKELENKMATKIQALFRGYLVRKKSSNGSSNQVTNKPENGKKSRDLHEFSICSVSSQSLAGSFLHLPKYTPYSAHNHTLDENDELHIADHSFDEQHDRNVDKDESKKKIGFHKSFTLYEITHSRTRVSTGYYDDEFNSNLSDESVKECIAEDNSSEEDTIDEIETIDLTAADLLSNLDHEPSKCDLIEEKMQVNDTGLEEDFVKDHSALNEKFRLSGKADGDTLDAFGNQSCSSHDWDDKNVFSDCDDDPKDVPDIQKKMSHRKMKT